MNNFKKYYLFLESDILMDYIRKNLKEKFVQYFAVDYVWFGENVVKLDIGIGYYGDRDNTEETIIIPEDKFEELLNLYLKPIKPHTTLKEA